MLRSEVVQSFVTTSDRSIRSQEVLHHLLEKLEHLDLTGKLVADSGIVQANHGGNGDIYAAYCWIGDTKVKVALKRLRFYIYDDNIFAKLLAREIRVWSKLSHPNVLELSGYIIEENGFPSLVSKWVANGTALEFVKGNPDVDIQPLVLGIAEGLEYIHSQLVIHSDIKSDNILISEDKTPLICDFGTSRLLATTQTICGSTTSGKMRGSTRWLAPEFFTDYQACHTKASDIWAFGMTVYELLAKNRPYHHLKLDAQVLYAVLEGLYPLKPESPNINENDFQWSWTLCTACWKRNAEERPQMTKIVRFLTEEDDTLLSSCTNYQDNSTHTSTTKPNEYKFVMYEHKTEPQQNEARVTRTKRRKVKPNTIICEGCRSEKIKRDSTDATCYACVKMQMRILRPPESTRRPCDHCRRRHRKCDKSEPACHPCLKSGLECKRTPLHNKARPFELPELPSVVPPIVQSFCAPESMTNALGLAPLNDSNLSSASTFRVSNEAFSSSSIWSTGTWGNITVLSEMLESPWVTQDTSTYKNKGMDAVDAVADLFAVQQIW